MCRLYTNTMSFFNKAIDHPWKVGAGTNPPQILREGMQCYICMSNIRMAFPGMGMLTKISSTKVTNSWPANFVCTPFSYLTSLSSISLY